MGDTPVHKYGEFSQSWDQWPEGDQGQDPWVAPAQWDLGELVSQWSL